MLDEYARRVKQDLPLGGLSADEGLRDLKVIAAVYQSIRAQAPVQIT